MADNDLDLENGLDMKDLTPEEIETYELLKWCDENPEKIKWVDGTDFLEKYADKEEN